LAYITDSLAIRQILDHLGLGPLEKPPPNIRDVVRVVVDEEGQEIEIQRLTSRPPPGPHPTSAGAESPLATASRHTCRRTPKRGIPTAESWVFPAAPTPALGVRAVLTRG
jgi:hypothetical protein